ncbi:serine protein kinase RIO [Pseudonocardia sp. CA-107938]|uniref:serine protein kinase RIO n=1 Tax=Pseudonocardia sp. CA-107938 TaxID=3240021 RepID=UPI003D8B3EB5
MKRRRRFDDLIDERDEPFSRRRTHAPAVDTAEWDERGGTDIDGPPEGDRWSTWDGAAHGPEPRPDWVITDHAAVDAELGVLKTGKEADVHLLERWVPGTDRRVLLAAKRYRTGEHRLFHRDAGYLEGRRVRRSREMRAMANRTAFGRDVIAGQWAGAEFAALCVLWSDGLPVPYPVSYDGTEVLIEFLRGTDEAAAAPRLAQLRPDPDDLVDLWHQLSDALHGLARRGWAHGDLSAYNVLVEPGPGAGRLVLIDLPQVVDIVGNPNGPEFLARDVTRIGEWFVARGLPPEIGQPESLLADLAEEAGITPH